MPGVLEQLTQMVTPEMVGQVAKMLGVDEQTAQQGMATAGPLLQQLLADKTSTPEGAQQVYDTVTKADTAGGLEGMLGSLTGAAGGMAGAAGAGGSGQGLVDLLLGPQARQAVTDLVRKQTGMDIGPMLGLAAPLLAGALGKLVKEQNLDASGLAGLLQTQSREYASQHPEMQGLLNDAVQASHQTGGEAPEAAPAAPEAPGMAAAMAAAPAAPAATEMGAGMAGMASTTAAETAPAGAGSGPEPAAGLAGLTSAATPAAAPALSADDLALLAEAPAQAGGLVMAASPSGGAGAAQEISALAAAVSSAAQAAAPGTLLGQLADPLHSLARRVQTDGLPATASGPGALEALRGAVALASTRATAEDAAAYKDMLREVADRVARAAKEGGFLGIGAREVSDSEAGALEAIKSVLEGGTPASGAPSGMR